MLRRQTRLLLPLLALAALTFSGCPKKVAEIPTTSVTLVAQRPEQADIEQPARAVGPRLLAARPAIEEVQLAQAGGVSEKPEAITFNDLKFEIKPSSRFDEALLTPRIKALEGKPIRVAGVMLPTFQQKNIKEFILLMNTECKYGSAKDPLWCNIRVTMDENEAATFTTKAVSIEGVLNLDVLEGENYDISLYTLDEAKVVR